MKSAVITVTGVLACVMFCGGASAAVVTWDLSQDLATGTQTWQMAKVGDGYGDLAAGNFNPPVNAGIQPDGTARFVDTGSYGNDGFVMKNTVGTPIGTAFTVDMMVWGERPLNSSGRSMGVRIGTSTGTASTGIGIEPASVYGDGSYGGGNSLWMTFRNGSYIPYGFLFQRTHEGDGWRAVRLSCPGDGSILVYDFVDGTGAGTLVGTVGPSPFAGGGAGGELDALGFHLNSLSGGTVTSSGFSLKSLAMNTDQALDGASPFIPEPCTLLLLGLGGLVCLRRRR